MEIIVDGKPIPAEPGEVVLEAALRAGLEIPHLCYHSAVSPYAACRLCMVEVKKGRKTGIQASCTYPVAEGLVMETNTAKVLAVRRLVVELLLARSPETPEIQELARKIGVGRPLFEAAEKTDCILCGLCVRVCEEVIGASAIGFAHKGAKREVVTPFDEPSDDCIGCLACVAICPTRYVKYRDEGSVRLMETWRTNLEMVRCNSCGRPVAPGRLIEVLKARLENLPEVSALCPRCKTGSLASSILEAKTFVGK